MRNLRTEEKGSVTLEAAMAFPVFLGLMLLLINVLSLAVHYLAMDHAVGETVKLIAAGSYPLRYFRAGVNNQDSKAMETVKKLIDNPAMVDSGAGREIAAAFGSDMFTKIAGAWLERGTGSALEAVISRIATDKIREMYPLGGLDPPDFSIGEIRLYNPHNTTKSNGSVNGILLHSEDVAIMVRYRVKLALPFFPRKEVVLTNCAVERAWVDDN